MVDVTIQVCDECGASTDVTRWWLGSSRNDLRVIDLCNRHGESVEGLVSRGHPAPVSSRRPYKRFQKVNVTPL